MGFELRITFITNSLIVAVATIYFISAYVMLIAQEVLTTFAYKLFINVKFFIIQYDCGRHQCYHYSFVA